MKPRKQGRPAKSGTPVHVLLRLSDAGLAMHNRYSPDERSDIYNRALQTIFPRDAADLGQLTLIRPLTVVTNTVCRIVVVECAVKLFLPEKRDDFRGVVKRFLYAWDGSCWQRQFLESIDIVDRAAEIGCEILLSGFCVQVQSDSVKQRIIDASFRPEAFRTIKRSLSGLFKDCFVVSWPKGDDFYEKAMRITAARYSDGSIYVPPEHYLDVADFAEIEGFEFSQAALDLAEEARLAVDRSIIVSPKRRSKKADDSHSVKDEIPKHLRDEFED